MKSLKIKTYTFKMVKDGPDATTVDLIKFCMNQAPTLPDGRRGYTTAEQEARGRLVEQIEAADKETIKLVSDDLIKLQDIVELAIWPVVDPEINSFIKDIKKLNK